MPQTDREKPAQEKPAQFVEKISNVYHGVAITTEFWTDGTRHFVADCDTRFETLGDALAWLRLQKMQQPEAAPVADAETPVAAPVVTPESVTAEASAESAVDAVAQIVAQVASENPGAKIVVE